LNNSVLRSSIAIFWKFWSASWLVVFQQHFGALALSVGHKGKKIEVIYNTYVSAGFLDNLGKLVPE